MVCFPSDVLSSFRTVTQKKEPTAQIKLGGVLLYTFFPFFKNFFPFFLVIFFFFKEII